MMVGLGWWRARRYHRIRPYRIQPHRFEPLPHFRASAEVDIFCEEWEQHKVLKPFDRSKSWGERYSRFPVNFESTGWSSTFARVLH